MKSWLCHGDNYKLELMWQGNGDQHTALNVLLRDKAQTGLAQQARHGWGHGHCQRTRQNIHNTDELSKLEDTGGPADT